MDEQLKNFERRDGASDESILALERAIGMPVPADYAQCLRKFDGGEGLVGDSLYLVLWGATEVARLNEAYQAKEYVPGLILFGSDGGGEAFAFDTRHSPWSVVQVPFVGLDLQDAQHLANSFSEFIKDA